jgi:hypothetical protein
VFVFDIRWFKDVLGKAPQGEINVDGSGFMIMYFMLICNAKKRTFILASHCDLGQQIEKPYTIGHIIYIIILVMFSNK